jgi:hypothetical protein
MDPMNKVVVMASRLVASRMKKESETTLDADLPIRVVSLLQKSASVIAADGEEAEELAALVGLVTLSSLLSEEWGAIIIKEGRAIIAAAVIGSGAVNASVDFLPFRVTCRRLTPRSSLMFKLLGDDREQEAKPDA